MFTEKQISKIAGITPRTLHYYDEIGLLKPSQVGDNGYRYYGEEVLLRLQQILFYRELGLPLEHIKVIVRRREFDVLSALGSHRQKLRQRIGEEGNAIYRDILPAMPNGASSPEAQVCVERWRHHIEYFWTPNDEQLVGLVNLYSEDLSLKANFDNIHPDDSLPLECR